MHTYNMLQVEYLSLYFGWKSLILVYSYNLNCMMCCRCTRYKHACALTTLVMRMKVKYANEDDWTVVRVRPAQVMERIRGQYKQCGDYLNHRTCKVGLERCTFCHGTHEAFMWGLERDGHLVIRDMVDKLRRILLGALGPYLRIAHGVRSCDTPVLYYNAC